MPSKSSKPQSKSTLMINILLSVFSLLVAILIEAVDVIRDVPNGLGQLLGIVSLLSIVIAVATTHVLIGRERHSNWKLWQPFLGGWRFVTLQSAAWTLLSISLYLSGLALHPSFSKLFATKTIGLPNIWTLTCTIGVIAEVLLLSSLPLYESPATTSGAIQLRWNDLGTINIIVSVLAMLTLFFLEKLRPLYTLPLPQIHRIVAPLATLCAILAILITHSIVGKMCHGSRWKFWQAFQGGWR